MSTRMALAILAMILSPVSGNIDKALRTLGWTKVLVVSTQHRTLVQTSRLAMGGIYAALGNTRCYDRDSVDGTVVEMMTNYNETLLGIGDQCGNLKPFRNLVVMSNHTMAMMEEGLTGSNKSIGLFGLLVPEGVLVRIVKQ